MSDVLDVYLHGAIAGTLERRSQARLHFTYTEEWVGSGGAPLSLSLPVRSEPFDHDECSAFFEGLLPEGDFLKAIARTLHVSAANPFQLLTELGGECAGAISVAPAGGPQPGQDPRPPRWLSEEELASLLGTLPQRPLIAAIDEVEDGGFRLSLAGAQDKVGVLVEDAAIGLSHGKPPTTAILKPPIPRVEGSVANEAFCMSLAGHVDLEVAAASPRLAGPQEYLLVHRYDRSRESPDGRIHQEDFCQALGVVPAAKYEAEGGPSVADCADLIRRYFAVPARDITLFLDALLFNFVIANHDAHGKNFSLLLEGEGAIRLAPLYDLLSTAIYAETDRKLAMRYGGEYRPAYLRGRHLDRLARDLAVKPALIRRRALSLCERLEAAREAARRSLPEEFQDQPVVERMAEMIAERAKLLRTRAAEADPARASVPERLDEFLAEMNAAADRIRKGFEGIDSAIEAIARTVREASGPPALEDLEGPARRLRIHGRDLYDAVADFEVFIESILEDADGDDEDGGLDELARLSELAATGLELVEGMYRQVSAIEEISPVYRSPVRNMRSGLRDLLEARTIISGWKQRSERGRDGAS